MVPEEFTRPLVALVSNDAADAAAARGLGSAHAKTTAVPGGLNERADSPVTSRATDTIAMRIMSQPKYTVLVSTRFKIVLCFNAS